MQQGYTAAGIEPPLEELLDDQIARLVMRRDGIGLADVWRAVEAARSRMAAGMQHAAQEPRSLEPAVELPPTVATDRHTSSPSG